jgi:hypothetical protein
LFWVARQRVGYRFGFVFRRFISKVLSNAVNAFSSKAKLPGWAWSADEKQWR